MLQGYFIVVDHWSAALSVLSGLECSDFVQWLRQASLSAACTVCKINVRQGLID